MYAYWILLALGLLPLIYAHCLDPGDPGMPASRWVMLLAAVTWGLLFAPLSLPDEAVVAVSVVEVVWANLVSVLSADLLWSQAETYVIDARTALSPSMLAAGATCVGVALMHALGGGGADADTEGGDTEGGDADMLWSMQDPFVRSLTLFVSIATCAVTICVGLIRRALNRAFLNVRYDNYVLGGLIALNAGSGLALVSVPAPWNVPLNRGVLWTVLFLALTKRKAQVGRYFAPLRDEAHGDFARCIPRPPVPHSGAPGRQPLPQHGVVSRGRYRVMTREEDPLSA